MEKMDCPTCGKDMSQHDEWQAYLCMEKFVKVATNPVAYGSVRKLVCPTCKETWETITRDRPRSA